jgi:DNA-binding NarL/FixJ family response regulator
MFQEAERASAMRAAGAVTYLTKSGPSDALVQAIRDCADSSPAGAPPEKAESTRQRKSPSRKTTKRRKR